MSDQGALTAEMMGSAARTDPQLRIPVRPRVRRGLVITPEADQLVVEGGPKKQMLRGRTATEVLPNLLGQLDGTRDRQQVQDEFGLTEDVLFKILALLWTSGVIEEGAPERPLPTPVDDGLADFLSRMGDSTGANDSWEQAAFRLQDARVEIFGDGGLAALVHAELARSLPVALAQGELPATDTTLVVCVGDPSPELAGYCWRQGLPLLRFRVTGRSAVLGPFVESGVTPCFGCLTTEDQSDERVPGAGDRELAASLFAREIFALISRSTPTPLPLRWRSVDLETLAGRDVSSATRVGCPACSISDGPMVDRASTAARFEAYVALPPKEYADPKAHQRHYKPSNLALQRAVRAWPTAAAVSLPPPPLERLADPQPSGKVTADELSLLLTVLAGIQGEVPGKVLRWTATGGNIGSVTAFCAVRDVPGVDPGGYAYVPAEHRLARLSPDIEQVAGDAPATIVLTGDYGKVAYKYAAFALRIVLLDSGCAQAAARAVARAVGVEFSPRTHWDDDHIAALVGVDPDQHPITAVIDLGSGR